MKKIKKIIIGIDGVPFNLINKLSDQDVMPFFNSLKEKSVFKPMASSIPFISSVSWSSIITGDNPGNHGVFGFTDMIEGTYTLSYPNFLSLKSKPFWQRDKKEKHLIINVPSTYPAQELSGVHISGFVSPSLEKAIYPNSELETLEKLDYQIDIDSEKSRQSPYLLYNQLTKVHQKREKTLRYLANKIQPEILMYVITGSDRLGHFRWDDWEDKGSQYHQHFLDFFKQVDSSIKKIVQSAPADTPVVILSDHGMEKANYDLNLNQYLIEERFLDLDKNINQKFNRITKKTTAFALEHGRIYLNYSNKYPQGTVKEADRLTILENLKQLFGRIEIDGKRVVKEIHYKEDIYSGDQLDRAPDLILVPNSGFNFLANLVGEKFKKSTLAGTHNNEAFLLVRSTNQKEIILNNPGVEDIVSIIDKIN